MSRHHAAILAALCVHGVLFVRASASAHIDLMDPPSRYPANGNKSCPCGEGDSNRSCNVPAEDSSDPNRSTDPEKITVLEAGSTITLTFDEYVGHTGRFRVAFDVQGADLVDFNDHVLADIPDPSDGSGIRTIEVTLPDVTCDNCTLQLLQAMHGDTENPVADPAPLSTYYTCADITLVPRGSLGQSAVGPEVDGGMFGADGPPARGMPGGAQDSASIGGDGTLPDAGLPAVTPGAAAAGAPVPRTPPEPTEELTGTGSAPAAPPGDSPPVVNEMMAPAPVAPSGSSGSGGCKLTSGVPGRAAWMLVPPGLWGLQRLRRRRRAGAAPRAESGRSTSRPMDTGCRRAPTRSTRR